VQPYTGQILIVTMGASIEAAADRSLGQLYGLLGRRDEANRHFEAAWRLEDSMGFAPLAARTRYWHAQNLVDTGDPNDRRQAIKLLRFTEMTASNHGMTLLQTQAHELFTRLTQPSDDTLHTYPFNNS
jgi:hypothetical protein